MPTVATKKDKTSSASGSDTETSQLTKSPKPEYSKADSMDENKSNKLTDAVSEEGRPRLRRRRSLLEMPPNRKDSSLYTFLANNEDGLGADNRTQDELIASPTYAKSVGRPHNDDKDQPLYALEEVPYYLRDNAYIKKYYRAYYSTQQCLRSLFHLHNETLNIWTHLLGGVLFIFLGISLFVKVLIPEYRAGNGLIVELSEDKRLFHRVPAKDGEQRTTWPLWIFGFYSFSCLLCMACSTFFHLFLAHLSEHFYGWAHAFDYFGITFLVVGSFLPFCFYVFSCQPQYRNLYIGMICCLGLVGLLGPFFRRWTSEGFVVKKILFYVAFVGSGMFPIVHMCFLPHDVGMPYVGGLMTMMGLYGVGVFIYAFKLPEIFFPGKFDLFCSSHQIWHLCVLGAALTHFVNCVSMYTNLDQLVCDVEYLPASH